MKDLKKMGTIVNRILHCAVLLCITLLFLVPMKAEAAPKVMYDGGLFDPYFYAETYPDVKAAYGYNENLLYSHYKNYGRWEGRLPYAGGGNAQQAAPVQPQAPAQQPVAQQPAAPAAPVAANADTVQKKQYNVTMVNGLSADPSEVKGFNAEYYAASNPELVAVLGNDPDVLYRHYINYGRREGRKANASGSAVKNLPLKQVSDKAAQIQARKDAQEQAAIAAQAALAAQAAQAAQTQQAAALPAPSQGKYTRSDYPQAAAVLDSVGWNLTAAFNWSSHLTYYGHGKPDMPENGSPGTKWFAEFGFNNLKGNCYVMAATFTEMARLLGYNIVQVSGQVPSRKGGLTPHSWCEMYIDGVTYVFDPDFAYNMGGTGGFQIQYGQKGTWRYTAYTAMSD